MIDRLRDFLKKITWLTPIFITSTVLAFVVFGYVIIAGPATDKYVIPAIVMMLWSLVCSLLLLYFPHVPQKSDRQQGIFRRWKTGFLRTLYRIGLFLFCLLSALALWLTLRLLNIWRMEL